MKFIIKISLLSIIFLLSFGSTTAFAEVYNGTENGFTWSFDDETFKMTIEGSGEFNQSLTNEYCSKVIKLEIGEGITAIKEGTFARFTNLLEVILPSTVELVAGNVFRASTIGTIRLNRTEPPVIESNTFKCNKEICVVFVPDGCKKFYAKDDNWLDFENIYQGNQMPDEIKGNCGNQLFYSITPGEWELTITGEGDMTSTPWSNYATYIYKVNINDGVTSIANSAFSGFIRLQNLLLPNSLKTISRYAFNKCNAAVISLPANIEVIEAYAFLQAKTSKVILNEGLRTIEEGAFMNSALNELTLPSTLEEIGKQAFSGTMIKDVSIPSSCISIGESVFSNCTQLNNIELPEALEIIPKKTFDGCSSLEKVNFTTSLKQIQQYAFYNTNITKVILPASIEVIGDYAFGACKNLTSITLPENIEDLTNGMFEQCTSLSNVVLPSSLKSIGKRTFYGCSALTKINLPESLQSIGSECFMSSGLESLSLPESLVDLGSKAFEGTNIKQPIYNSILFAYMPRNGYTTYEIPQGITIIGNTCFSGCKELTNVIIPSSVKIIGEQAFQNCTSLKNIDLSCLESPKIMTSAFSSSGISSVSLPSSVAELGTGIFQECVNLDGTIDLSGWNIPYLPNYTFTNCKKIDKIILSDKLEKIGNNCFIGCEELEDFSIPGSLSYIGGEAFKKCMSIENIVFPKGNCEIGSYAFSDCINLREVTFNDGLKNINGEKIFNNCSKLKKVHFPESLNSINLNIFTGCTKLDSIFFLKETAPIAYRWYIIGSDYDNNYWIENNLPYSKCVICVPSRSTDVWKMRGYYEPDRGYFSIDPWLSMKYSEFYEKLSGTYGSEDNTLNWELDTESGNLKITGKGIIPNDGEWGKRRNSVKNIVVEGDFKSIADSTFMNYINLENVSLPETIEEIGKMGFACTYGLDMWNKMKSIVLPKKLKRLGSEVFRECAKLEYVQMPDSIIEIGKEAFAWCFNLKELTIPRTVKSIGASAFHECYGLKDVYSHIRVPIAINNNKYYKYVNPSQCTLHVHVGTKNSYLTTAGWEGFGSIVEEYVDITVKDNEFGSVIGDGEYKVGQIVTLEAAPIERYKFLGWSNDVTINPYVFDAETDITLEALFIPDTHVLSFVIDGDCFAKFELFEGDDVAAPEVTPREGYIFNGWSEIPATMPAKDVIVVGKFIKLGDGNGDGKITITDAVGIVNYILGNPSKEFTEKAGDVNGDGKVSITDAVSVVNIILNQNNEKPASTRDAIVETENTTDPE